MVLGFGVKKEKLRQLVDSLAGPMMRQLITLPKHNTQSNIREEVPNKIKEMCYFSNDSIPVGDAGPEVEYYIINVPYDLRSFTIYYDEYSLDEVINKIVIFGDFDKHSLDLSFEQLPYELDINKIEFIHSLDIMDYANEYTEEVNIFGHKRYIDYKTNCTCLYTVTEDFFCCDQITTSKLVPKVDYNILFRCGNYFDKKFKFRKQFHDIDKQYKKRNKIIMRNPCGEVAVKTSTELERFDSFDWNLPF